MSRTKRFAYLLFNKVNDNNDLTLNGIIIISTFAMLSIVSALVMFVIESII